MTVKTNHPLYTATRVNEWRLMRHSYEGESTIKDNGVMYLPKPSGWSIEGGFLDDGLAIYNAYKERAIYPEIVSNSVRAMVGVVHGQEFKIELPPALEYLFEVATADGLPLEAFSRRITTELLLTGRYGALVDAPDAGGGVYLAGYTAESIVNWDEARDFYVLRENVAVRNGFAWDTETQSRVLKIVDGRYQQELYRDDTLADTIAPTKRGGGAVDFIPLVIGGAMDLDLRPDVPPLIGVARAAKAYYQLSADHRMALYQAYQDTLIVYDAADGVDGQGRAVPFQVGAIGAGVAMVIHSKGEGWPDARAEYVSPSGQSIEAQERAMQEALRLAAQSGARLFDNTPRAQESGEARRLRFSAETATLQTIAMSSAAILEKALKYAALMMGANPDDVIVTPPANMLEGRMESAELQGLLSAWREGAISYDTFYSALQRGRIASVERDAQEEAALIDADGLRDTGEM